VFLVGLWAFVGLAGGLVRLVGFGGTKDYAILLSKWTVGFLERIDSRSKGSAILYKWNYINSMNSSKLWVPRNAKALKCNIAANEGIAMIPPYAQTSLVGSISRLSPSGNVVPKSAQSAVKRNSFL